MSIQVSQVDRVSVFTMKNDLGAKYYQNICRTMSNCMYGSHTRILLDFSALKTIDSTTIGLLLKLWLEIKRARGKLVVLNPNQQPLNLIKQLRLQQLFPIEFEKSEAFKRLL